MSRNPRILMITTSHDRMGDGEDARPTGIWLEEVATPYFVFQDAGARVTLVSMRGGTAPIDPASRKPRGENPDSVERFLDDREAMAALDRTGSIDGLRGEDWDAVFLPGGHGTMWDLPENEALARLLREAWMADRVIAAVCHGPAGLLSVRDDAGVPLVTGRRITAFSDAEEAAAGLTERVPFLLEDRLRSLGALYGSAPAFQSHALADGRLVTGQNPASSAATARLALDALGTRAARQAEAITVPVGEGHMDAYLARPEAPGRHPAVIVGMELFGVTGHIRSIVDRFAAAGFLAIAPNFYHRSAPGVALPHDAAGRERGFELLHALSRQDVLDDTEAVLRFLRARDDVAPRIGFAGFSVGGLIAYLAAAKLDLSTVAVFYAGWLSSPDGPLGGAEPALALTPDIADRGTELLFFVGENDALIPEDTRTEIAHALRDAGVRHRMVVYPGVGHGFFCDERDGFDREARDDAWTRLSRAFLSDQ